MQYLFSLPAAQSHTGLPILFNGADFQVCEFRWRLYSPILTKFLCRDADVLAWPLLYPMREMRLLEVSRGLLSPCHGKSPSSCSVATAPASANLLEQTQADSCR